MKRILMRIILVLVTFGLALAYTAREGGQVQNNREDEEAIKRVITGMTEAFNRHEAKVSFLTRDVDFVYADGNWLKGAAEIERGRKARFETVLKEARLKLIDIRIRFIKPDVALAHVTNEISGMIGPDGQEAPVRQELNLRVLVKENGKWLLTAFHNTTLRR